MSGSSSPSCSVDTQRLESGARNLLLNCVGLSSGEQLLLVREPAALDYYDQLAPDTVETQARRLGADVRSMETPLVNGPEDMPASLRNAMAQADHTVFMSRIGDQLRFYPVPGPGTTTMCYALDARMLAGDACQVPYQLAMQTLAFVQMKLDEMNHWRVTCPLGTDISGRSVAVSAPVQAKTGFTVRLFPPGPFRTVSCTTANGRLVSRHFPGSATHRYEPYGLILDEPISLVVANGRIVDFEGPKQCVEKARAHYEHVAAVLQIDAFAVHSWHAGTNPKIWYPQRAESDVERWNGVVHSHTRYTHFHTCGDYNPGEIVVGLIDASIIVNDEPYWLDGRLELLDSDEASALLLSHPDMADAFEMQAEIGV